jgi:uncharacterized protein (TIGR04255 family)
MAQSLTRYIRETAPERKIYQRAPLALVLCQVRFVRKYRLATEGAIAPFQEALETAYPNAQQSFSQSTEVQIGGPAGVGVQPLQTSPLWQFSDQEDNWTVTLAPDFITLETRKYQHFEDFLDRLTYILRALATTVRPTLCRRVGLRYIDEIRSSKRDWPAIFRPEVLGLNQIPEFHAASERSHHIMTFNTGRADITLQHGLFPTGSTVLPRRGEIVKSSPFYLFDIDMYREFHSPKSIAMDPDVIRSLVQDFHDTISALFRWATTDEYRSSLGERDDVG